MMNAFYLIQKENIFVYKSILETIGLILLLASCSDNPEEPNGTLQDEINTFAVTFGGSNTDLGETVQETSDGGFIIGGTTNSFSAGDRDFWLIKTDALGNEVWNQTYGGSGNENGWAAQETSDGGFILVGTVNDDIWFVKTDALGNEEWNQTYGGGTIDAGSSVQQTSDGGFIIGGLTLSFGAGEFDFWLLKTDALGNEEWNQTYGGSDNEFGRAAQETSDGGFIIVGCGFSGIWLVKTDSDGNETWNQKFDGTCTGESESLHETSDGGFIIVGSTINTKPGFSVKEYDIKLVKTDALGNEEWTQTYEGIDQEKNGLAVQGTSDGGFIIVGHATLPISNIERDAHILLVKTDALGNEVWTQNYEGGDFDIGKSVQQTSDGGFIIIGTTVMMGTTVTGGVNDDILLIKTDSKGNTVF